MEDRKMPARGARDNPPNRFVQLVYERDAESVADEALHTEFFADSARSIIAYNDSPDVGFDASINPYRGCEHGCAYCYARPTHEFLGFSAGLDFEAKIIVKQNAPELLRAELRASSWKPQPLAISGVTDAYQPIERRLEITRRCLEVLAEARNPVAIVTKNKLVTRDKDLLGELARYQAAAVYLSITTLDGELARRLEPRASTPQNRLEAISELAGAGIPVGVMVAPVIPGLTDHEIPAILKAAREAGAAFAGYTIVRLPFGVADIFSEWLEEHYPARKEKVLNRLREMRGGALNDRRFGYRMSGKGVFGDLIRQTFKLHHRRLGFGPHPHLSTEHFRKPPGAQLELFG